MREALAGALRSALTTAGLDVPAEIHLERPARRDHGDWSSNVALTLAKAAGRNPRQLAEQVAGALEADPPPHVTAVEVAGPGFVNFRLDDGWLHDLLREIVASGDDWGRHAVGNGERVLVEFVSANPTGPIHVGNGWFASYGDALCRLLERCGWSVSREYYVNDTGGQIRKLGDSVLARRRGEEVPDGGYAGAHIDALAAAYEGDDDTVAAGSFAAARILDGIKESLERVHIRYDEWFSQASIEEGEAMGETIAMLDARGVLYEEDGALWLRTAEFGDPREKRVLRKSDGDYTYLAGDIAYHRNKLLVRAFDRAINVWGADHQAQVPSLVAGVAALGVEPGRLEVRLGQMVAHISGRMSKRLGNAVDLDVLVDELGPDVVRLLSLVSSIDQAVTLDLEKVRAESKESPVFYVQYAHARIASIGRVAAERGVARQSLEDVDLSLLLHDRELDLLRTLDLFPEVVLDACLERAPHRVTAWVRELADRFHGFYHDCYVMGQDVPAELTQARLWLVEGARRGFAAGLDLLGVQAPESM